MNQKIKVKKKVRKLNYKKILFCLIVIAFFIFLLIHFINQKITNIYIHNNKYIFANLSGKYSEQDLLKQAGIDNYPSSLLTPCSKIKKNLLKNIYIKDAKVSKKNLFEVHIYVYENRPLFYNNNTNKTVLETSIEVDDTFDVPTLINYVPDKIYKEFTIKMATIDDSVLNHISEIKYDPNTFDEERFLCTMTDGNYVYITLNRFDLINNYLDIIKEVGDKKGVLYLDYGDHFVFE